METRSNSTLRYACCCRWVEAGTDDEQVVAEILNSWEQPSHVGGCGNSGR